MSDCLGFRRAIAVLPESEGIPEPFRTELLSALDTINSGVRPSHFLFRDLELPHVALLMGANQLRFGADLWHYLVTARAYLEQVGNRRDLFVDGPSEERRRRIAEDMGVAIACLLMVRSFGVRWRTVTQIPKNRKFSRFTPDFVAFDRQDRKWVLEAKGTTNPSSVASSLEHGKEQVEEFRPKSTPALVFCTYLGNSSPRSIPSCCFVTDPPLRDHRAFDTEPHTILCHVERVLAFARLQDSHARLVDWLALKLKQWGASPEESTFAIDKLGGEADAVERVLDATLERELREAERREFGGRFFVGQVRRLRVESANLEVFMGVDGRLLAKGIKGTLAYEPAPLGSVTHGPQTEVGYLPDGTVLAITRSNGK